MRYVKTGRPAEVGKEFIFIRRLVMGMKIQGMLQFVG